MTTISLTEILNHLRSFNKPIDSLNTNSMINDRMGHMQDSQRHVTAHGRVFPAQLLSSYRQSWCSRITSVITAIGNSTQFYCKYAMSNMKAHIRRCANCYVATNGMRIQLIIVRSDENHRGEILWELRISRA
jgi:hypothetical protein